jgi:alkylated DNA repair dioxygenase AlkB
VVSAEEESSLIGQFAALPFKPFDFHGFLGKRRVVSYGWRYDYAGGRLSPSEEIPVFLLPLRERAAAAAHAPAAALQQILVTEYDVGAGIGWHRDKAVFGDVIALSLASACRLRFRRRQGSAWERRALEVKPRSLYVLSGPARRDWEHSVPSVQALRYSITFRTLAAVRRAHAPRAH